MPKFDPRGDAAWKPGKSFWWLAAVLALAAALRLVAISYGLPAVFNSDEPFVVDVAVSFGAGTLNPHLFKYPTLWMYLLFASYGVYFLLWSGLGLLRTVRQFGQLFAWHPGVFFLIGRLLAAAVSLLGCERVYRTGKLLWGDRAGLLAAAFLAVSPALVLSSHSVKMDQCVFFLAAWSLWFAVRHLEEGRDRDLLLCGLAAGLSVAAQYPSAPLGILVPAAWLGRRWGREPLTDARGLGLLAGACALVPAGFLLGTPFALLDFPAFKANMIDLSRMETGRAVGWLAVTKNLFGLPEAGMFGASAAVLGLAWAARREPRRALLLGASPIVYLILLSPTTQGGMPRYLYAAYPAAALLIGAGASLLISAAPSVPRRVAAAVAAAVLLGPGLRASVALDRELLLPDTRTLSTAWIEKNIPAGTKVLLDQDHASPRLAFSRPEVERLLEKTRRLGHPRARYYAYMLDGHPGGGYDVSRVLRDFRDLGSYPGHVRFSTAGQPMLDVSAGLSAARAAGIQAVVLTSLGATREGSPELRAFLTETEKEGRLLAEFAPKPGEVAGPLIRVYSLEKTPAASAPSSRR
jgi:hypothetical protein